MRPASAEWPDTRSADRVHNPGYNGLLVHFDLLRIAGEPMQQYHFSRLGPPAFGARENCFLCYPKHRSLQTEIVADIVTYAGFQTEQ